MKQAFVVVGPESSGNKLMTALLLRAGCVGSAYDDRENVWAHIEPATEEKVVLIYSYPNGSEWPDLRNIYWRLTNKGYLTWALVMVRDHYCVVCSQEQARLKPRQIAEANYQRAYREIFTQIQASDIPYLLVPYESLLMAGALQRLLQTLRLPTHNLDDPFFVNGRKQDALRDENAKHYAK